MRMRSLGQVVPIAKLTQERHHLLDVAYWMLGNGPVPENVVNEAYQQWYGLSIMSGVGEPVSER
jgi:RNA polymerase sigma-70 factor, ECF subfamily